jgi:hypothetical protein
MRPALLPRTSANMMSRGRFSRPGFYAAMSKRALFKFRLFTADHTMNSTGRSLEIST